MQTVKKIDFRIATLTIASGNLVTVKYKNVEPFPSLNEVDELITEGINLINHQPFLLLTDLSKSYNEWDNETKLFVENHTELNQLKIAEAVIVRDFSTKLLVAGYSLKSNNPTSVKMFREENEAMDWLKNNS